MGNFTSTPGYLPSGLVGVHLSIHSWPQCESALSTLPPTVHLTEYFHALTDRSRVEDGLYTEASPLIFSALETSPGKGVQLKHLALALAFFSAPAPQSGLQDRYKWVAHFVGGGNKVGLNPTQLAALIVDISSTLYLLGVGERVATPSESLVIAKEVGAAATVLGTFMNIPTSSAPVTSGSGKRPGSSTPGRRASLQGRRASVIGGGGGGVGGGAQPLQPQQQHLPFAYLAAYAATQEGVHSLCTRFKYTPAAFQAMKDTNTLPTLVETTSVEASRSMAMDACRVYEEESRRRDGGHHNRVTGGRFAGWGVGITAPSVKPVLMGVLQQEGVRGTAAAAPIHLEDGGVADTSAAAAPTTTATTASAGEVRRAKNRVLAAASSRSTMLTLASKTRLSMVDLENLHAQFSFATTTTFGTLTRPAFSKIMLANLPSLDEEGCNKIFSSFDEDGGGTISFEEFVVGAARLVNGGLESKLELLFTLFATPGRGGDTVISLHSLMRFVREGAGELEEVYSRALKVVEGFLGERGRSITWDGGGATAASASASASAKKGGVKRKQQQQQQQAGGGGKEGVPPSPPPSSSSSSLSSKPSTLRDITLKEFKTGAKDVEPHLLPWLATITGVPCHAALVKALEGVAVALGVGRGQGLKGTPFSFSNVSSAAVFSLGGYKQHAEESLFPLLRSPRISWLTFPSWLAQFFGFELHYPLPTPTELAFHALWVALTDACALTEEEEEGGWWGEEREREKNTTATATAAAAPSLPASAAVSTLGLCLAETPEHLAVIMYWASRGGGGGRVSAPTLLAWMLRQQRSASAPLQHALRVLSTLDRDGSGTVTRREFMEGLRAHPATWEAFTVLLCPGSSVVPPRSAAAAAAAAAHKKSLQGQVMSHAAPASVGDALVDNFGDDKAWEVQEEGEGEEEEEKEKEEEEGVEGGGGGGGSGISPALSPLPTSTTSSSSQIQGGGAGAPTTTTTTTGAGAVSTTGINPPPPLNGPRGFAGVALFGLGLTSSAALPTAPKDILFATGGGREGKFPPVAGEEYMKASEVIFQRRVMVAARGRELQECLLGTARALKTTEETTAQGFRKAMDDLTLTLRRNLASVERERAKKPSRPATANALSGRR